MNSSLVGIPGTALTPTTGRNQDDGNLNFNKGAPVSEVVNGYLSLAYKDGDYSVLASVKAWYDYALERAGHPWGNIPNGYTPDASLSELADRLVDTGMPRTRPDARFAMPFATVSWAISTR